MMSVQNILDFRKVAYQNSFFSEYLNPRKLFEKHSESKPRLQGLLPRYCSTDIYVIVERDQINLVTNVVINIFIRFFATHYFILEVFQAGFIQFFTRYLPAYF